MRSRRRSRNYRNSRNSRHNKAKLNFTPVIVILCLSVGCGYATAKYVVEPVVSYVPNLTAEETDTVSPSATAKDEAENKNTAIVEDEVKVTETKKVAGYALQFGCYSGESVAEAAMRGIDVEGLRVMEQDGMYKIVGKTYDTKEKAAAALKELPETVQAFVTTIYK